MAADYTPPGGQGKIPMPDFNRFKGLGVPALVIIAVAMFIFSSLYSVGTNEKGVVQRFGKYVRTTDPGLHMRIPFGIETYRNIPVTTVLKEEFGYRTAQAGVRTVYATEGRSGRSLLDESLMLTGDLNVAVVQWTVQYKISDPVKLAFRIRNPRSAVRDMSEAVMRSVVGDHTIDQVLTTGREMIQFEVREKLQSVLDTYDVGIRIDDVFLQDVTPPAEVEPSFNDVNKAKQEKDRLRNQAYEEYNRVIPLAKGQADQQIEAAKGYAVDRVNRAQGDTERFLLALEAYKLAPEVTKKRLYLEMAQSVYPQLKDKMILDDGQKGILPLINLHEEGGKS